jgi:hypothetical protein
MTAEIALLNKMAVTLAADSAVTIGTGASTKVYNSADKIFEATNYDPIGIMVYNSPELHGIPVESIVKMYRDKTCSTHYPTVFAFADAFLSHIQDISSPATTESDTIQALIAPRMFDLRKQYAALGEEFFNNLSADDAQHKTLDDALAELEALQVALLDREIEFLESLPEETWSQGLTEASIIDTYSTAFLEIIGYAFQDLVLPSDVQSRALRIAALALLKEYQRDRLTGLVFAGFGQDEIFPSLVAYEIYGNVAGRLKYVETRKFDVDRALTPLAAVIPFAQQEMVDRFMYGLDSQFLELCRTYFAGSLGDLKQRLGELLIDADEAIQTAVGPAIDAILEEFNSRIVHDHIDEMRAQLSDMVRSMPKQELAALSESLVHITSLKRKFSAGAESVGGPIDVAMITRAEGFVWVKRKHYFDAHLNPRYFSRRYGQTHARTLQGASAGNEERER